jgi:hypothetical protein
MRCLSSRRRLALTGYPLQNNMEEYYTMIAWVSFVVGGGSGDDRVCRAWECARAEQHTCCTSNPTHLPQPPTQVQEFFMPHPDFKAKFIEPITRGQARDASPSEKAHATRRLSLLHDETAVSAGCGCGSRLECGWHGQRCVRMTRRRVGALDGRPPVAHTHRCLFTRPPCLPVHPRAFITVFIRRSSTAGGPRSLWLTCPPSWRWC